LHHREPGLARQLLERSALDEHINDLTAMNSPPPTSASTAENQHARASTT
jgi:hypothetical protein